MIKGSGLIGFLTFILALLSVPTLLLLTSDSISLPQTTQRDWYLSFVYYYYGFVVLLAGLVIGSLTFLEIRRAWIYNAFFQGLTISILVSTFIVIGVGFEYRFGDSMRDYSIILASVILSLLIFLNWKVTRTTLNRTTAYFDRNKKRWVSIIAILLAIAFWTGLFDPMLSYPRVSAASMANPLDKNEQMYVYVIISSPTFAANTPATIDVTISMNYTYRNSTGLSSTDNRPDSFWLIFDGSQCGTPYRPDICYRHINHVDEDSYFGSYSPITYTREGAYNITLTAGGLGPDDPRSTTETPVIHISPTEGTNEFRTFKMSIIIGIIAGAIGLLALFFEIDHGKINRDRAGSADTRKLEP